MSFLVVLNGSLSDGVAIVIHVRSTTPYHKTASPKHLQCLPPTVDIVFSAVRCWDEQFAIWLVLT